MFKFQGTGFAIDLPEDVADASSYTFVRDCRSPNPPMLQISSTVVTEIPTDPAAELKALDANEGWPKLKSCSINNRDNWLYATATLSWGEEETAIWQRMILLYVDEEIPRKFTITMTAMQPEFDDAVAYFSGSLQSFRPNEIQKLLPQV